MLRALVHRLLRLVNPPLCTVAISTAGVRCVRGAPPARWLADCADVARELGIRRGSLDVVDAQGRLQLRFSPDLPPACHQRFRNVLGVHLASLRPPRRRR